MVELDHPFPTGKPIDESWQAILDLERLVPCVEGGSVLEGTGGIKSLTEKDKADIKKTIDKEVLKGTPIEFRSSKVEEAPGGLNVHGELSLCGRQALVVFDLTIGDDGRVTGSADVAQTAFGIKPYSALFGALKVADEVQVEIESKPS